MSSVGLTMLDAGQIIVESRFSLRRPLAESHLAFELHFLILHFVAVSGIPAYARVNKAIS
jgi:hypothetical protein